MGVRTSWENQLDESSLGGPDGEIRLSLKSPRVMVGTISGRFDTNSFMSDKNVVSGCCGRL